MCQHECNASRAGEVGGQRRERHLEGGPCSSAPWEGLCCNHWHLHNFRNSHRQQKKKPQPFQAGIEEMGSRSGLRAVSNRLLSRAGFSSAHFLLTKTELKPTHDSAPHGAQCSTPTPTEPSPYRSWLQTNPLRTAAVPEHQQMNHPPIHTASEAL